MNTFFVSFFILITLIQLIYWCFIFKKLANYQNPQLDNITQDPVSIIICAKNEAKNLKKNLDRILSQNYPCFEVIVVDDGSTDSTQSVLLEFQKQSSILHTVSTEKANLSKKGKKFALAEGIKHATYNVLLLTDADCKPTSLNWLANMQKALGKKSVVLGFAPYHKDNTFLNRWIRYETVWTAIQYLSFALIGHPYMGVGRNLMYRKSLYYKAGGFESHEHIASGDDDLFINAIAHLDNTTITLNAETFMLSEPERTWTRYFKQKSRHYSTSTSYRLKHQVLLGLLSASHFLHYFLGTLLVFQGLWTIFLVGYLLRTTVIILVSHNILRKLDDYALWWWFPLMDVSMIVYYLVFGPVLFLGSKKEWQART